MPRSRINRYAAKGEPSKFFSMEANPEGASIGNFVNNIKEIGSLVKKGVKKAKARTARYSTSNSKEEGINKNLQSMGYKDIQDFYDKNPDSNFNTDSLLEKGVKYVGRKIKKVIKRYE